MILHGINSINGLITLLLPTCSSSPWFFLITQTSCFASYTLPGSKYLNYGETNSCFQYQDEALQHPRAFVNICPPQKVKFCTKCLDGGCSQSCSAVTAGLGTFCAQEAEQLLAKRGIDSCLKAKSLGMGKCTFQKMVISGRYSHRDHCLLLLSSSLRTLFPGSDKVQFPSPDQRMEEQTQENMEILLARSKQHIFPTPGILPDFVFLNILHVFLRKCSHATCF